MIKIGFVSGIVISIVAADIVVRLILAPYRRDSFVEGLLENITEAESEEPVERAPVAQASRLRVAAPSRCRSEQPASETLPELAAGTAALR